MVFSPFNYFSDPVTLVSSAGPRAFIEQDLSEHAWKALAPNTGPANATLFLPRESTCTLSAWMESASNGSYALIGHHGTRTFGGVPAKRGFVSCGIVFCKEKLFTNLDSCGKNPEKGNSNSYGASTEIRLPPA